MPRVIMNVDFDDEVILRDHPMTVADIEQMLACAKEMGADTIVWRCTTLGRADFRSDVMDRSDLPLDVADLERAEAAGGWFKTPGDPRPGVMTHQQRIAHRDAAPGKMTAILSEYDPPAVARETTRRMGLDLYLWLDIFDEYFPGHGSRFLEKHPHCQWLSRDGERRFDGLRCYGYPEALENQLDVVRELAAYEPDGLYFSTSCHSRHRNRTGEWDDYGFDDPVVARYKERHGVDIRTGDFDRDAWHRIKGEFVTNLCARAKALLSERGQKLMLPAPIGDRKVWDFRLFSGRAVAQFHADWRAWADRGIADSLIVGEYQPTFRDAPSGHWLEIAERTGMDVARLETLSAAAVRDYVRGRCEVFYWASWMRDTDTVRKKLERSTAAMRAEPLDGVVYHEMYSFERNEFFPQLGGW